MLAVGVPPDRNTRRDLRVELSGIDDSTARELLDRYTGMVVQVVRLHGGAAARAFHLLDLETLISIGQTALLEAHVTYREGDVSRERVDGAGFRTWARRVVGWRISEAVHRQLRAEPEVSQRADSHNGVLRIKEAPTVEPDEQAYHHELGRWLKRCLARLDVRERTIVALLLRGETKAEIARSLGLSESRVGQLYFQTLRQMREWAVEDGVEGIRLVE